MEIKCPYCGFSREAPEGLRVKIIEGKCPNCDKLFEVKVKKVRVKKEKPNE